MNISIHRNILSGPLAQVAKIADSKSNIPILAGVLFRTVDEGLLLMASDGKKWLKIIIPSEDFVTNSPGDIILTAKDVSEVVARMPNGLISIEVAEKELTNFASGRTKLSLIGMRGHQFALPKEFEISQQIEIDGGVMRSMIKRTVFAIAKSQTSPMLTGVRVRRESGGIQLAACDRNRAAIVHEQLEEEGEGFCAVISGEHLKEVADLLGDDIVTISVGSGAAKFQTGNLSFYANALDGEYPTQIDSLSKIKEQARSYLKSKHIIESLERARITAGEDSGGTIVTLDISSSEIIVKSKSHLGNSVDWVETMKHSGTPLQLAFNDKKLLEALKALGTENVLMRFGSAGPVILSGGDEEDTTFFVGATRFVEGV
ncbi:DNA polymerase III subunit beta [Paenibacillus sepulcri]|uniref:Beta sliding clamp n=1 Tax=Paenibacillus sepulcri TaxID=359917 RepID=A0ABS7BYZ1_9BACL|nr:DNA polymerase III subunit beta [Paenibacillus sepulcri]